MIPINFLAASRIQAAIECLPRTAAEDHNDRYSAGKGEIEMSTFTPGPWVVFDPKSSTETFGIDGPKGEPVVWYGKEYCEGIPNIADAVLMADAPAMLDALELCAIVLSGERMSKSNLVEALEKAHALIAKHRGGK